MKRIVVKHLDRISVLEVKVVVFHVCSEWEYMSRVSSLTFPTLTLCEQRINIYQVKATQMKNITRNKPNKQKKTFPPANVLPLEHMSPFYSYFIDSHIFSESLHLVSR